MPITPTEAADIAVAHGLTLSDARALAALANTKAEAVDLAKRFAPGAVPKDDLELALTDMAANDPRNEQSRSHRPEDDQIVTGLKSMLGIHPRRRMMYDLTPDQVVRNLKTAGAIVPKELTELVAAHAAVYELATPQPGGFDALLISGETFTAKEAADTLKAEAEGRVFAEQATTILQESSRRWAKAQNRILRRNGDSILESMRPKFDGLVKELAESVAEVGTHPTNRDFNTPTAARAVATFRETTKALAGITSVRASLGAAGYGPSKKTEPSWYITTADTLADLERADRAATTPGDTLANLLAEGFDLRLNLPHESAALIANAEKETTRRRAQAIKDDPRTKAKQRLAEKEVRAWEQTVPST